MAQHLWEKAGPVMSELYLNWQKYTDEALLT